MSILIICDQAAERQLLTALATEAGLDDVKACAHPAAALDWCESNVPDLVVIDFLMRATDGVEVIRRLRAMPAMESVPLVLMLPHGFESVSAEAWKQGATDFLAKPVDPTEFIARARNLLALRGMRLRPGTTAEIWRAAGLRRGATLGLH